MKISPRLIMATVALAAALPFQGGCGPTIPANTTITDNGDALALAQAMTDNPNLILSASLESPGGSTAIVTGPIAGFPMDPSGAVLLSTGLPQSFTSPNVEPNTSGALGGLATRGDTAFDITVLRVNVNVPAGVNCASVEFKFHTEEFPEYIGTGFNDAFIAELDRPTWLTAGALIQAPDNFAFGPGGEEISVNSAGVAAMNASLAEGTTFDGSTATLRASTPITPGLHALYFSIFDQSDQIYDSAVLLDSLQFGTVADPGQGCQPGVTPPTPPPPTVPPAPPTSAPT